MTTGHVFIATSLDGFIAREDGELDWLMKQPTAGEDYGYDAFMESVDGIVMGRKTYEKVLSFGEWSYPKPVVVPTRTLTEESIPEHLAGRVSVSQEAPAELMQRLGAEGWKRAYIDGGQVIQSFLRAGLIETITVSRIPILLGSGIPLFGGLDEDIDLRHVETKTYPSGIVGSQYEVASRWRETTQP